MEAMRKRRAVSPAALAAALASRRAKAALPKEPVQPLGVFAVRHPGAAALFAWEIRRHGGIAIARGTGGFADASAARAAGRAALEERRRGGCGAGREPAPAL